MNKLFSAVSQTMARTKVKAVKYGPAISVGVGIVGMGAALYLAYRATTKIEEAKAEKKKNLETVDGFLEAGYVTNDEGEVVDTYNTSDAERDTRIYNSRYIFTVVKHVAGPVVTFAISALLIGLGFKTMATRLALAGTTIAGLTAQLADVNNELENAVGKEKANDIMLGKHTHTETEIPDDGEVTSKTVTTTNRFITGYTFEFSKESSPMLYSGIYDRDIKFIEGTQNMANYYLKEKKGFVTFADILAEMDIQMDTCGYALSDGSINTPGHTIVFDIDERKSDDGKTYFIITVNFQGYIIDRI